MRVISIFTLSNLIEVHSQCNGARVIVVGSHEVEVCEAFLLPYTKAKYEYTHSECN